MSESVSKRHNVGSARWELTKTNDPHGPYIVFLRALLGHRENAGSWGRKMNFPDRLGVFVIADWVRIYFSSSIKGLAHFSIAAGTSLGRRSRQAYGWTLLNRAQRCPVHGEQ